MSIAGLSLPEISAFDPPVAGEGSLDPMGLAALSDRLADLLVPGIRSRMQRIRFVTATAHSVFLSREAGATTTDIEEATLLTVNVPYVQNGWYVIPTSGIVQVKADSIATNAPTFGAWGYSYV